MSSLNEVNLIGRLGGDPECRKTQSGDTVVNMTVATSEKWKDKSGNSQEKTDWHRCVLWGGVATVAERYLKKGSRIFLRGKLQTRKWTDQSGQDKYTTEVVVSGFGGNMVMLDGKSDGQSNHSQSSNQGGSGYSYGGPDLDDDIPFAPLRELP
jgi:single-strand DNA-binding protein